MKRFIDVVLAAVGLALSSPVLLVAAVAVRLDSPGPIIFRQLRVGRGGQLFYILKLRTMRTGEPGSPVTTERDPRITRCGRCLRSTKLDEIPQLVNVLRGDMSMVGPRPEVPRYVMMWPEDARKQVLSVRPGVTDPASIEFRRESELLAESGDPEQYYVSVILPRKVAIYCDYVRGFSLAQDFAILVRTLRSVARK